MARNRRGNESLLPQARPSLDRLKFEVASEIGALPPAEANPAAWDQRTDKYKYEVAAELGLLPKIQQVGWGEMSSRECGAIGGRIGGPIGGQMVKRMIAIAEQAMANQSGGAQGTQQ